MEKRILAIGGHVIKTTREDLRKVVERGGVDMLIHNGGSLFHDFQLSLDSKLNVGVKHSYSLGELLNEPELNVPASLVVWNWLEGKIEAPEDSITRLCQDWGIPVLMFTSPGCDFWHLFQGSKHWALLGEKMFYYFEELRERFKYSFHYVCMGSAVIHPEVFTKAIASVGKKPEFRADVVDFLDMYRPRTRVSQYGKYYKMMHKEYFYKWLKGEL